jgi:hypothetical protein
VEKLVKPFGESWRIRMATFGKKKDMANNLSFLKD